MFRMKGDKPQWQLVADFIVALDGAVASVADLAVEADCKPSTISALITKANARKSGDGVQFASVPGGYRIALPGETLYRATETRTKVIARQANRIKQGATAVRVDPSSTPVERMRADEALLVGEHLRSTVRRARADVKATRREYQHRQSWET